MYEQTITTLGQCLRFFVFYDAMNAAVHTAAVRYSPITFRVAEALEGREEMLPEDVQDLLSSVLAHRGAYQEDPGR
jgi:hypothetical protein